MNPSVPSPAPFGGASRSPSGAPAGARVVVQGLRKEFIHGGRRLTVLNNINFEIRSGEIVSVIGASGAGKSTLLHMLGTIDLPTSGTILFDDVDVTRMPPAQLAEFRNRQIGFVFQFHHLLPEFTALENVMMPGLILRLPRAVCAAEAKAMLIRLGLGERLTHRPGELSGGEQQRVALARALLLKPRLLLADEPTGNLDTKTGRDMHDLFLQLNRELGMTLLIVTHNAELAAQTGRRLRITDGTLVERD